MPVFNTLYIGSNSPEVELLQLALERAGFSPNGIDGAFGAKTFSALTAFQRSRGLTVDGVAGSKTWSKLLPFLTGYQKHTVQRGDTIYKLAKNYGTTVSAIMTANPDSIAENLQIGSVLTIPFAFDIIPTNVRFTSLVLEICIDGLRARYPFIRTGSVGNSVIGRDIHYITIGSGDNQVFYNASHHANEWITTPVLMKFLEEYVAAYVSNGIIFKHNARTLFSQTKLYVIPMINPDGVDLVTGQISSGRYFLQARAFAANYPEIPFPDGWKANIDGVDLNLQYPAGWEIAREIKYAMGITSPAPRDFVGYRPLSAPESRAAYELTLRQNFSLTLSYHTQGEVVYWKYLDYNPRDSYKIAREFAEVSGYEVEETPYESGHAGYKDWFILHFNRPGYTIEAGLGTSPLPLEMFDRIYSDNIGILTLGLTVTAD